MLDVNPHPTTAKSGVDTVNSHGKGENCPVKHVAPLPQSA